MSNAVYGFLGTLIAAALLFTGTIIKARLDARASHQASSVAERSEFDGYTSALVTMAYKAAQEESERRKQAEQEAEQDMATLKEEIARLNRVIQEKDGQILELVKQVTALSQRLDKLEKEKTT